MHVRSELLPISDSNSVVGDVDNLCLASVNGGTALCLAAVSQVEVTDVYMRTPYTVSMRSLMTAAPNELIVSIARLRCPQDSSGY